MSKLAQTIRTVLSLLPPEALKGRFTMINGGMGFASRDYAGERNWLIIDNDQNGRAMVLTGALYAQFEAQMGAKTAWTGTPEEVLVAQDEIILKFFAACEEEGYEFLRENNAL